MLIYWCVYTMKQQTKLVNKHHLTCLYFVMKTFEMYTFFPHHSVYVTLVRNTTKQGDSNQREWSPSATNLNLKKFLKIKYVCSQGGVLSLKTCYLLLRKIKCVVVNP